MATTAPPAYGIPETHVSIEADEDDDLVAIEPSTTLPSAASGKGKGKASSQQGLGVSGNIGSSSAGGSRGGSGAGGSGGGGTAAQSMRQMVGGIQTETRYTGMDTLDEPVLETVLRDVRAIAKKIVQVLRPSSSNAVLREWDLWGPLVFCLCLAVELSITASPSQSLSVFTGVFVIVWLGSAVVTLNAKLLGGKVSFFQSLCVLGYCLFPINIAALVAIFVRVLWVRVPVSLAAFGWSVYAAVNFLGGTRLEDSRAVLAVYPTFLLFFLLSWIVTIS